jgi:hypothetical protein
MLLPLHAHGDLDNLIRPACARVERLVAGEGGTGVPVDSRLEADLRLARRTQSLIRQFGGTPPGVESLIPEVTIAREFALKHQVPVSLVLAVIHRESGFDREAVSPVGAVGLMQVMPAVARDLAESEGLPQPRWLELLDTRTNIEMGVILLSRLHERYRSWDLALAAYNAGDRAFVEDDDDGVRDDVQAFVRQVSRRARVIRTARAAVPAA